MKILAHIVLVFQFLQILGFSAIAATSNIGGHQLVTGGGTKSGTGTLTDGNQQLEYSWNIEASGIGGGSDDAALLHAASCVTMRVFNQTKTFSGGMAEWTIDFPQALSGAYLKSYSHVSDYYTWTPSWVGAGDATMTNDTAGVGAYQNAPALGIIPDGNFVSGTTFRFDRDDTPNNYGGTATTMRIDLPSTMTQVKVRADIANLADPADGIVVASDGISLCFEDVDLPAVQIPVKVTKAFSGATSSDSFDMSINCHNGGTTHGGGMDATFDEDFTLTSSGAKMYSQDQGELLFCDLTETLTTSQQDQYESATMEILNQSGAVLDGGSRVFSAAGVRTERFNLSAAQTADITALEMRVTNKAIVSSDLKIEVRTPNGDGGLGPFDVRFICRGSAPVDTTYSIAGGSSVTYNLANQNENLNCSVRAVLTAEQRKFFKVKNGDTQGVDNGSAYNRATGSLKLGGETMYIELDYVPTEVVDIQVAKVLKDGDDGGKGPFNVNVYCSNGDTYDFEMEHGDIETFQFEKNKGMSCVVRELLTVDQKPFFKLTRGDTFGPSNGGMRGNSTTISESTGTLKGGVAYTGGTMEVYSEYVPEEVVDIQVAKVVKDGDDGSKGPFDINVYCSNGDTYDFEMEHGDIETFQFEKDTGMACRVREVLTDDQKGFFKVKHGDTFGPNNGAIRGNSTTISESTGTLKGGVAYTGGTMEVYNEYVPDEVVKIDVSKQFKDGDDGGKGPINVNVYCSNGDTYDFEMEHGDIDSFYIEKDTGIACRVREVLTDDQKTFFKIQKGDTFGPNNGAMRGNSTTISESSGTLKAGVAYSEGTMEVYSEYIPTEVVKIDVTKQVKDGDDGGKGPFNLKVACSNGDEYSYELAHGETDSFYIEKDTRIDCRISEELTDDQKGFFDFRKGDTFGPNNGRMLGNSTTISESTGTLAGGVAYTGGTMEVYNTYVPEGTVEIFVEKTLIGDDLGLSPFIIDVACEGQDVRSFKLDAREKDSFHLSKTAAVNCSVTENMTTEQAAVFDKKSGDTFGADNGNMVAASGQEVDKETFYVLNSLKDSNSSSSSSSSSRGGGGSSSSSKSSSKAKDDCPDGDNSGSNYDGKCDAPDPEPTPEPTKPEEPKEEVETSTEPKEVVETPEEPKEEVETPTEPKEEVETPEEPKEEVIPEQKPEIDPIPVPKPEVQEPTEVIEVDSNAELPFKLPSILPKTGSRLDGKGIKIVRSNGVDTTTPTWFKPSSTTDMNYWVNLIPYEEDRNADEYIVIPTLGMIAPVKKAKKGGWDYNQSIEGKPFNYNSYLADGVMQYPGSPDVGQNGNAVIFAHSSFWNNWGGRYKTIFSTLPLLDPNEEVWVYKKVSGQFVLHRYQVTESYETDPSNVEVLLPKKGKNLTLFTCTDIGTDRNRWVINAELFSSTDAGTLSHSGGTKAKKQEVVSEGFKSKISSLLHIVERQEDEVKKKIMIKNLKNMLKKAAASNSHNAEKIEYIESEIDRLFGE